MKMIVLHNVDFKELLEDPNDNLISNILDEIAISLKEDSIIFGSIHMDNYKYAITVFWDDTDNKLKYIYSILEKKLFSKVWKNQDESYYHFCEIIRQMNFGATIHYDISTNMFK